MEPFNVAPEQRGNDHLVSAPVTASDSHHAANTERRRIADPTVAQTPDDGATAYVAAHFDRSNPFVITHGAEPTSPIKYSFFVNLAANVSNSSLLKDADIQAQIAMTRGKPIEIIVQTVMSTHPDRNDLSRRSFSGIKDDGHPQPEETQIVRYKISNGSIQLLHSGATRGFISDFSDLLNSAPKAMQAEHVIVIDHSHGGAMAGLEGNGGEASVQEFKSLIATQLKHSGRNSIDVLDLDSCLMGNTQALSELSGVSRYIVASEREELNKAASGATDRNAQPLAKIIAAITANPKMDTREAAQKFVDVTATNCTRDSACGINTIAVFDSAVSRTVSRKLDELGKALLATRLLGNNAKELQKMIAATPPVDTDRECQYYRDLLGFADQIDAGLKNGTITDSPDKALAHATAEVIDSTRQFIVADFTQGDQPFSGLSTTLVPSLNSIVSNEVTAKVESLKAFQTGYLKQSLSALLHPQAYPYQSIQESADLLLQGAEAIVEPSIGISMGDVPISKLDTYNSVAYKSFLADAQSLLDWSRLNTNSNPSDDQQRVQLAQRLSVLDRELDALAGDSDFWRARYVEVQSKADEYVRSNFDYEFRTLILPTQPHWNQFLLTSASYSSE